MADNKVSVQIGKENYSTRVKMRQHELISDEPKDIGGADLGPKPSELLAASLGACMAITMRMYAERKEWPLEEVKVELSLETEEVEHDGITATRNVFQAKVILKGNLDEAQEKRIRLIGTKCPIHKLLHEASVIRMS